MGSGGSKTRFLGVWTPKKWPFWLKNVTFWGFWGFGGSKTPKIDKNVYFLRFLALFRHLEAPKMVIFGVLGVLGSTPIGCCTFRQVWRQTWLARSELRSVRRVRLHRLPKSRGRVSDDQTSGYDRRQPAVELPTGSRRRASGTQARGVVRSELDCPHLRPRSDCIAST